MEDFAELKIGWRSVCELTIRWTLYVKKNEFVKLTLKMTRDFRNALKTRRLAGVGWVGVLFPTARGPLEEQHATRDNVTFFSSLT